MSNDKGFDRGLLAGVLLMLGASAMHWFITPMAHPGASTLQRVGVIAQALIGFGGFAWLTWRNRRRVTA
jgi:threonine/homoserine/homoserine lactone efflux protein